MRLDEDILLADFATRSYADLITLRDQARSVVFGLAQSISILSQSTQFSREDASTVLKAVNQAILARNEGDDATDPLSLRPAMGHAVRFSGSYLTAP